MMLDKEHALLIFNERSKVTRYIFFLIQIVLLIRQALLQNKNQRAEEHYLCI